jgi:hypothetical protein
MVQCEYWQRACAGLAHAGPRCAERANEEHDIFESVRTVAYKIIQGKGATNYAVGLAVCHDCGAILWNEGRVLPVSSLLTGYPGISDVCLSVPSIVWSSRCRGGCRCRWMRRKKPVCIRAPRPFSARCEHSAFELRHEASLLLVAPGNRCRSL